MPDRIRIIADENVSWRLKNLLKHWDVLPANQIITSQRISDNAIWQFAKNNNYQILTFDEDFSAIQTLYGYPPKIIWLRTGNLKTTEIALTLLNLEVEIKVFLLDPELGVFEITSHS